MKILLMSDTHDDRDVIENILNFHPNCDAYIHCGDSELLHTDPIFNTFHVVRGNCDLLGKFPLEKQITLENHKIYITHGHVFDVKKSLNRLFYKAKEKRAEIVCFGHTHLAGAEKIDDIVFINPGSLTIPRGRVEKSFAILSLNEDEIAVSFYDEQNRHLEDLDFKDHF